MTDQTIFLAKGEALSPLVQTPYATESILQEALARFPEVLAGVATEGDNGALLLVSREMPVPGVAGASGLSLDHLFIDSEGVPVLVEVKRSTDTRARREVVAQMLDYAANAVAYWPVERLRALVEEAAHQPDGVVPIDPLAALGEHDPEQFWRTVEQNLRAGRIRLIFLADRLAPELVRIIEFLNEQMHDVEVLGVEVPQYTGADGSVVYVPRVIGRTSAAVDTKRAGSGVTGPRWARDTLLDHAREVGDAAQVALLERLIAHVTTHSGRFSWGTGATPGVTGWYPVDGKDTPVWNVNLGAAASKATLYFIFREYVTRHPKRVEGFGAAVENITDCAGQVRAARSKQWRAWVPLALASVTSSPTVEVALFAALEAAVASRHEEEPGNERQERRG